jgi:RNA polymerase sigma-70 factor (ECF subfamily)
MNELDQTLLVRCLEEQPRGWEDFVDRFMGLVVHVIDHTVQIRGINFDDEQRDRLCEDVFLILYHDSFRLLREFDGQCSLTTYMTVIARRIIVRMLLNRNVMTTATTRKAA